MHLKPFTRTFKHEPFLLYSGKMHHLIKLLKCRECCGGCGNGSSWRDLKSLLSRVKINKQTCHFLLGCSIFHSTVVTTLSGKRKTIVTLHLKAFYYLKIGSGKNVFFKRSTCDVNKTNPNSIVAFGYFFQCGVRLVHY